MYLFNEKIERFPASNGRPKPKKPLGSNCPNIKYCISRSEVKQSLRKRNKKKKSDQVGGQAAYFLIPSN